jgi:hypothetical protein
LALGNNRTKREDFMNKEDRTCTISEFQEGQLMELMFCFSGLHWLVKDADGNRVTIDQVADIMKPAVEWVHDLAMEIDEQATR